MGLSLYDLITKVLFIDGNINEKRKISPLAFYLILESSIVRKDGTVKILRHEISRKSASASLPLPFTPCFSCKDCPILYNYYIEYMYTLTTVSDPPFLERSTN